ncbi:hypothetical protein JANAI62_28000 [Jannaschia pagri]|uniref:PAP2 superfamily protein n=1 Tax=Jannaschia pagri TaxID=2829797 RepID=A0ABQ4NQ21_9RHOB|nr:MULTISPECIES: phosphatase PAP2 family protein [unclassified Jannaschia]GIT92342.1 hypothetical protein JANAI61_28000 [Jannaschia sp. AI_61]GIT96177.1 hypothetical protein JANAI62_28000 [Jannaschia sp. AI_62]
MVLPPYGAPSRELRIVDDGARPKDWSGSAEDWAAFYAHFVEDVSEHISPKWDMATGTWTGASAQFATEATRRELDVVIKTLLAKGIMDQIPITPTYKGPLPKRTHYWLYAIEDYIGPFLSRLQSGEPVLPPADKELEQKVGAHPANSIYYYDDTVDLQQMPSLFGHMFQHKYNGIFQTKLIFRRARPQQTAFMLGLTDFEWRQAQANVHTGNHPALISGHCAQGLLFACTIVDKLLSAGRQMEDIPMEAYSQFAVDFGDRRVFGGVHYPTDNIASWIAVMRMIPWVFPENGPTLLAFIQSAIRDRSLLYGAIEGAFSAPDQPLLPAWTLLQQELAPADAGDVA